MIYACDTLQCYVFRYCIIELYDGDSLCWCMMIVYGCDVWWWCMLLTHVVGVWLRFMTVIYYDGVLVCCVLAICSGYAW